MFLDHIVKEKTVMRYVRVRGSGAIYGKFMLGKMHVLANLSKKL